MRRLILAVDLGATNLRLGVFDIEKSRFVARAVQRTNVSQGPEAISSQIVEAARHVLGEAKFAIQEIEGVGVVAPGPLDLKRGGIVRSVNIPYDFVPVKEPLEEKLKKPVYFMHDAKASAMAEYMFGAGKTIGTEYLVFITISTGIGGGIVDGGRLVIGVDGNAGEIGCITVDYRGKMRCGCGSYGHWQAYASGAAIPRYVKHLVEEEGLRFEQDSPLVKATQNLASLSADKLYQSARTDPTAMKIVEELATINAAGVANVINAVNPEVVTLGGSIVLNNLDLTIDKIAPRMKNFLRVRAPTLLPTPLGGDIGIYGAVASALSQKT
ncbi:MAG: ROK family protein [Nitrososphaerota archaeon]